jgi:hypothetical protein
VRQRAAASARRTSAPGSPRSSAQCLFEGRLRLRQVAEAELQGGQGVEHPPLALAVAHLALERQSAVVHLRRPVQVPLLGLELPEVVERGRGRPPVPGLEVEAQRPLIAATGGGRVAGVVGEVGEADLAVGRPESVAGRAQHRLGFGEGGSGAVAVAEADPRVAADLEGAAEQEWGPGGAQLAGGTVRRCHRAPQLADVEGDEGLGDVEPRVVARRRRQRAQPL